MASVLGGMGGGREYVLKIIADVKDAIKGVDDVSTKTTTMKDKMVGIGKAAAAGLATAAVVKFGTDSLQAAADADDAMDAVSSAFGNGSKAIVDFSKTAADKMGLSAQDYQTMAAETGRILTGFGIDNTTAANQTNTLAMRAADMAAIVGGSTEDAMGAIGKAMQGQTKGLKQYGISISNAEVEARAMGEGYVDASGKVTDAGKAIATQELILEKTAKYQGEFAKNSGDLGSQQEILKAKFENLQTTIGTALLPVVLKLFDVIKPLINFISNNISWIAPLAGAILAVAAAVKIWNVAQLLLNSTLLANPIFQVVAAITALVAGLIWAYNNVGWFKDAVDAMAAGVVAAFNWIKDTVATVFNWIKDNWPLLLAIITGPFGTAVYLIVSNWDTIKEAVMGVFNWIRDHWPLLLAILTGPFGMAVWAIANYWDEIKGAIRTAIDWIRRTAGDIYGYLKKPFEDAWNYISGVGSWIKDLFYKLPGKINDFFSGLANIIKWPFETAFNAIKHLWNSTVGGFGFNVPSWVPGIGGKGFTIPEMAAGGIVTRPTIALIGEAGAEAVVPLDRITQASTQPVVNINVYALTASSEVGKQVYNALKEYERVSGVRIGAA